MNGVQEETGTDKSHWSRLFPSLRLSLPIGTTVVAALIILMLIAVTAEILCRIDPLGQVTAGEIPPSIGSNHRQFEIQLALLDQFYREEGHVDCIFLGSSMVYRGIDPEEVNAAYRSQSGSSLKCFNFGVRGLTARTADELAAVLVSRYGPDVLVYGIDPRDFSRKAGGDAAKALEDNPWIVYQLGRLSPIGWALSHSEALRQYLKIRNWMKPGFRNQLASGTKLARETRPNGFNPFKGHSRDVDVTLDPDKREETKFFSLLKGYEIFPKAVWGLKRIVGLRSQNVEVVILEMPVHRTFLEFFENESDYGTFLETIRRYTRPRGVPFIESTTLELVPNRGWYDRNHLNEQGARLFSAWVGEQLGQALSTNAIGEASNRGRLESLHG